VIHEEVPCIAQSNSFACLEEVIFDFPLPCIFLAFHFALIVACHILLTRKAAM
jgi:hypothetical protein